MHTVVFTLGEKRGCSKSFLHPSGPALPLCSLKVVLEPSLWGRGRKISVICELRATPGLHREFQASQRSHCVTLTQKFKKNVWGTEMGDSMRAEFTGVNFVPNFLKMKKTYCKLSYVLFHSSKLSFALILFLSLHLCLQGCLFPPSVNVNTCYFETDQLTSLWKSLPMMW